MYFLFFTLSGLENIFFILLVFSMNPLLGLIILSFIFVVVYHFMNFTFYVYKFYLPSLFLNFIFFCFCPRLCVLVVLIMIAVVLRFHVNLLRPNAFWNTVCSNFPFVFLCISYSWLFFNFLLNEVKNDINEISPCKWISSLQMNLIQLQSTMKELSEKTTH